MPRILRTTKGLLGFTLILLTIFVALGADFLMPHNPLAQNLAARVQPPGATTAPGNVFVFGTDHVGRDVLSRTIKGAQISLMVALSAVLLSGVIGTVFGILAGYYGGFLGVLLMRVLDIQLAMPMILFAIAWIAFLGPGLLSVILVIGLWGWVKYGRLARGMVLSLKERPFVQASHALGASNASIMFRHIAPNLIGPIVVLATLQLGDAVLLESTLSFLGVGVQAPTPTWGGMVSDGRNYVDTAWWIVVFPGMAITLFVLGANFLGDATRDILDPKSTA